MTLSKKYIERHKTKLNNFYDNFDHEKFDIILKLIHESNKNNNSIILFAVGKSETVVQYFSSLLNSVNIKSISMSVTNCLHGDIGFIKKNDLIIFISNSGNTTELLNIALIINNWENKIIGIFANKNAQLIKYCNEIFILPKVEELDKFNIIPTTSIVCFNIFINILISCLIEYSDIKLEDYGKNHPNGNIGKKIYLTAKEIMLPKEKIIICNKNSIIQDCLSQICEKKLRCALIEENGKLIGIVTDGDIRRYLAKSKKDISLDTIEYFLNKKPFSVKENDNLHMLLNFIKKNPRLSSGIPVLDENNQIKGLISHDVIINANF